MPLTLPSPAPPTQKKRLRQKLNPYLAEHGLYLEDHKARSVATELARYIPSAEGEAQARNKWGANGFNTVVAVVSSNQCRSH